MLCNNVDKAHTKNEENLSMKFQLKKFFLKKSAPTPVERINPSRFERVNREQLRHPMNWVNVRVNV